MEKINFTNGQEPALNGTNLNQLQTNVENAIAEVETAITEVETSAKEYTDEKTSITITTDANGWKVVDFGTHKEYFKKVSHSFAATGSSWGHQAISSFPVGVSYDDNVYLTYSGKFRDAAVDINVYAETSGVKLSYRNRYGTDISSTADIDLRIIELPNN